MLKLKTQNTYSFLTLNHGDIFWNITQKTLIPYLGHEFCSTLKSPYDPVFGEAMVLGVFVTFERYFHIEMLDLKIGILENRLKVYTSKIKFIISRQKSAIFENTKNPS